jgi:cytochrome P450
MPSYLERLDATPVAQRWPLVRGWMQQEPHPFFAEVREHRPVIVLPELTLVFRHADCQLVLRRHDDFCVDLYKPKQGDYFMAQDDTAAHWREKSIMKAVLDFEQIPEIRNWVGERTANLLADGKGSIDLPKALTRRVPVDMVQEFFGLDGQDPDDLIEWSYWNQQDAFHNQPFDGQSAERSAEITAGRERSSIRLGLFIGRLVVKRSIAVKLGLGGDDPITRLLQISFSDGVKFGVKKVLFNAGGLLIGAVETTNHCVNNVMAELFSRPDALAQAQHLAKTGPAEAIDGVALEALRFRPAFPYFFRTCHRATEIAGGTPFSQMIQPGTTVLAMTHSAMSDPASFPNPTVFDPGRAQGDNFTFGQGIHECLGRAIAKPMLGEIVRQILLLPGLKAAGPVEFRSGVPEKLPITWQV